MSLATTPPPAAPGTPAYQTLMEERRQQLRSSLQSILPAATTLTLELGCGHGHFLTAYAKANPSKLCIGIDIVGERIERALRKRDRAALQNLHFIHTEGNMFLDAIRDTVISDLFILFPDPWPKSRHHKHRILQSAFLSAAARKMTANGLLCFRTDHQPYYEWALQEVGKHPAWTLTAEPWPFEFTTVFQSRVSHYHSLTARRALGAVGP